MPDFCSLLNEWKYILNLFSTAYYGVVYSILFDVQIASNYKMYERDIYAGLCIMFIF